MKYSEAIHVKRSVHQITPEPLPEGIMLAILKVRWRAY